MAREYTLGEASRILKVDRSTVWRWVRDGKLQSRRMGLLSRSWHVIPEEALRAAAAQLGIEFPPEEDGTETEI